MRLIGLLCACVLVVGCGTLVTGERGTPCGEFRNTSGSASIVDGAQLLGSAEIDLTESHDSTNRPNMFARGIAADTATGGPLKRHVVGLRLLDGGGNVLSTVVTDPNVQGTASTLFWENWRVNSDSVFAEIRRNLIAGQLRMEITTDEVPSRRLTLPVSLTLTGEWTTLRCL
jgi:hypothetical protein